MILLRDGGTIDGAAEDRPQWCAAEQLSKR
jgi:hypothetical protein